jgi:hypothetical protein
MGPMKKQTAVEWLIEQIGWYNIELSSELRFEIDKAKAMEKEQMEQAKSEGYEFATQEAITEIHKNYRPL